MVVIGDIVVIMTTCMAVSSIMAVSRAVTVSSVVAVAVEVAGVVAVRAGAYSITSLAHHRMAFPLLSQHYVLGTVLLPSRAACKQTLQGVGAGVRPHGSRETCWLVLLNGLHG